MLESEAALRSGGGPMGTCGPVRDDQRRLVGPLLHGSGATGGGAGGPVARAGGGGAGAGGWNSYASCTVERIGVPFLAGRLERELANCRERGLVEAVPGGHGHPRLDDRARLVDDDLDADGGLEAIAERVGRVGRLGATAKERRRHGDGRGAGRRLGCLGTRFVGGSEHGDGGERGQRDG